MKIKVSAEFEYKISPYAVKLMDTLSEDELEKELLGLKDIVKMRIADKFDGVEKDEVVVYLELGNAEEEEEE